jgi:hypothetical protein
MLRGAGWMHMLAVVVPVTVDSPEKQRVGING